MSTESFKRVRFDEPIACTTDDKHSKEFRMLPIIQPISLFQQQQFTFPSTPESVRITREIVNDLKNNKEYGYKNKNNPIHKAAKKLFAMLDDLKIKKITEHDPITGETFIHIIAKNPGLNLLVHEYAILYMAGRAHIDIDVLDRFGNSPLFTAMLFNNERFACKLLEFGADGNQKSGAGVPIVTFAWQFPELAKEMVKHGVNMEAANMSGNNIYHNLLLSEHSCSHTEYLLRELLKLDKSDAFCKTNKQGETPCAIAIKRGRWNLAMILTHEENVRKR